MRVERAGARPVATHHILRLDGDVALGLRRARFAQSWQRTRAQCEQRYSGRLKAAGVLVTTASGFREFTALAIALAVGVLQVVVAATLRIDAARTRTQKRLALLVRPAVGFDGGGCNGQTSSKRQHLCTVVRITCITLDGE